MALKNYTSQVSANRSILHIEAKLEAQGAKQILKEYTPEGKVHSIAFTVNINGCEMPFKIPAQVESCYKVLKGAVRRPNALTYKRIGEQAERTA